MDIKFTFAHALCALETATADANLGRPEQTGRVPSVAYVLCRAVSFGLCGERQIDRER